MYQRQCRLTIADKYYGKGGGGGGDATVVRRNVSQEWPKVKQWSQRWMENIYPRYRRNEPILSELYPAAIEQFKAGPSPLAQGIEKLGLEQVTGGPSPLLSQLQTQAQSDLARRGALSPEEEGRVRAATLATAGSMGMGYTPGTLGTALLNREQYRQQREGIARQFATGVEQLGEGDITRRMGLGTGAEASGLAETAQRFQIPQSVLQTGVGTFGQLTNPILEYLGKAFTPQVVGGTPDTTGSSAIGAVGSILGAAITAY